MFTNNQQNLTAAMIYLGDIRCHESSDHFDECNRFERVSSTATSEQYSIGHQVITSMSDQPDKIELHSQNNTKVDISIHHSDNIHNDKRNQCKENLCKAERIARTFMPDKLGINRVNNNVYKDDILLKDSNNGWWIDQIYYVQTSKTEIDFQYDPSFIYYGVAV